MRVLIVSSHPLFGQGLRSLLKERRTAGVEVIGMAANTDEAAAALKTLAPDLVILDYDDEAVNREEFLAHFVEGETPMRVVLVSLKDSGQVVVYDRRAVAASQVEAWLSGLESHTPATGSQSASGNLRRDGMKHFVIVGVLVVIVTVLVSVALDSISLLPVQASAQAVPIDNLFGLHFKVIAFLFSLIVVFIAYSVIVFRRRKGETGDGAHFEGHTGLEIVWTIAPLAIVFYFAFIGAQALAETREVKSDAMEVKVIASQWSWRFEYPEYGITSSELRLPANRQVLLKLTSTDVIHSFWVPEFRVKQDAIPGDTMVKELRVTPTLIGDYKVRCAELCGRQHAYMESPVIVMEPAGFEAWVIRQTALPKDPVERGARWAKQYACTACHSADGTTLVGPTWKGLFEKQETLTDGTTVTADETYLIESIVNPNLKVAQGFTPGLMPQTFAETLTPDQINDIVAYIKTLK
ncbi:MAG TPA: cytochrome c oxidase subunit II [Anaerolineales bacterium]|nr:cytochrome c oxidase subunit II [Anaerolineales bacterium]HLB45979.1 cytochrome c oxidase subunit II [Anaerolineales bacterium]